MSDANSEENPFIVSATTFHYKSESWVPSWSGTVDEVLAKVTAAVIYKLSNQFIDNYD